MRVTRVIAIVVLWAAIALAGEGMWLPEDWGELALEENGVTLPAEQWRGPDGVEAAVVNIGGGTGSLVSADGLVLTNHHVAYGALQRASSAEHNYLADGFFAASRSEELSVPGTTILVWLSTQNVTAQINEATHEAADAEARYTALEKIKKEIVRECEQGAADRCYISAEYAGRQFRLHAYREIKDVRIVYAPPEAIGSYGGDTDNWMWPRHAGDFTFLRVYVGPDGKSANYDAANVPYQPARYLELDASGVHPGMAVVTAGFPYRTRRHLSSFAMQRFVDQEIPWRLRTFKRLIDIVVTASQESEEVKLLLINSLSHLQNSYKKYRGIAQGLATIDLPGEKRTLERQVLQALQGRPDEREQFAETLAELEQLYATEHDAMWHKEIVLVWMGRLCTTLDFALTLNKWSIEREKPDMEREPAYMERNRERTKVWLKAAQRRLHTPTDRKLLAFMIGQAMKLPAGQRIETLDTILDAGPGNPPTDAAIAAAVDLLYEKTQLTDVETRVSLFDVPREKLIARNDAFLDLAAQLQPEIDAMQKKRKAFDGALQKLQPQYIGGILAGMPGPHYPDANASLRFSLGHIEGYAPRDGVWYRPQTTLAGVVAKHTGVDPFNVPEALLAAYRRGDFGDYVDPRLGDVPVDFLSTNDVTGGNSGSPILSGAGKVVGLVFDTNFEAVASDIRYMPGINRTINVDVRYILFMLDQVYPAPELRRELKVSAAP